MKRMNGHAFLGIVFLSIGIGCARAPRVPESAMVGVSVLDHPPLARAQADLLKVEREVIDAENELRRARGLLEIRRLDRSIARLQRRRTDRAFEVARETKNHAEVTEQARLKDQRRDELLAAERRVRYARDALLYREAVARMAHRRRELKVAEVEAAKAMAARLKHPDIDLSLFRHVVDRRRAALEREELAVERLSQSVKLKEGEESL